MYKKTARILQKGRELYAFAVPPLIDLLKVHSVNINMLRRYNRRT